MLKAILFYRDYGQQHLTTYGCKVGDVNDLRLTLGEHDVEPAQKKNGKKDKSLSLLTGPACGTVSGGRNNDASGLSGQFATRHRRKAVPVHSPYTCGRFEAINVVGETQLPSVSTKRSIRACRVCRPVFAVTKTPKEKK